MLADLGLFRIRSFRTGAIAALIVSFGEFGLLFTLPLLLQGSLGYSALGTGAVILVVAVAFLASGVLQQVSRHLAQRADVRIGLMLEALGVGGLALSLSLRVSTWVLSVLLFVYGFGVGFATAQLTSPLLAEVPVDESGQASELQSSVSQLGSAQPAGGGPRGRTSDGARQSTDDRTRRHRAPRRRRRDPGPSPRHRSARRAAHRPRSVDLNWATHSFLTTGHVTAVGVPARGHQGDTAC